MSQDEEPIAALGEDESWQLLASRTLGRLVTCVAGQPEIFLLTTLLRGPASAGGTKLLSAAIVGR